jgi:hypothetical protein
MLTILKFNHSKDFMPEGQANEIRRLLIKPAFPLYLPN